MRPHTTTLSPPSKKKTHLLLSNRSSCCCVWSSLFKINRLLVTHNTNKPHTPVAFVKSTHTHTHTHTHTKTKTKSKKMSQKSEQPPKAEEATPTHAHKHIDYSVRFSFFSFGSFSRSLARGISFQFKNRPRFSRAAHASSAYFFRSSLSFSLPLSLSRAPVLCAGRWYK